MNISLEQEEITNTLFNKNYTTINNIINYYLTQEKHVSAYSDEYDDIYQHIMVFIVKNLHKYNVERGAISTYVKRICLTGYSNYRRYAYANKRKAEWGTVSYDNLTENTFIMDNFEDNIIDKIDYEMTKERITIENIHKILQ